MNWQDICDDPTLRNLPFKIELNRFGQIVMSPASNDHGMRQGRIVVALSRATADGEIISECSVQTSDGTKVADAAWCSPEFFKNHRITTPLGAAPDVCVEILPPSNTETEMEHKKRLYFERGAEEVWFCESNGRMRFFAPYGELEVSKSLPSFPARV